MRRHKLKSNTMAKKLLAIVLLGLLIMLVILLTTPSKESVPYYPKSSFEIPEDVLKERIATRSAQTIRVPIIMYHYITYEDHAGLSTSPYIFEKQIESLQKNGYTFIFSKDIPDVINNKNDFNKPLVLTFDDGYEDFYFNVFPLLKKYNAKGTIYIVNNFIGKRGYLTAQELVQIKDSGLVEIGAHTLNHVYLKNLKLDQARKEIIESKNNLEKMLGVPVLSFAYPFGAFTEETLKIVKAAGFTNSVSVIPGVNQSIDNLFYLYRLRPGNLLNYKI